MQRTWQARALAGENNVFQCVNASSRDGKTGNVHFEGTASSFFTSAASTLQDLVLVIVVGFAFKTESRTHRAGE